MKNQFLIGERVYLRALELDDLNGNYINWLNDPEVTSQNSHHIFPYTKEAAEKFIRNAFGKRDRLILAVNVKESDIHIGNISLQNIDFLSQSAELAIMFGEKEYWGKGYSKEAADLILRHGFETMNLRRIHCGTFSGNIPMQKLATYLGFKKEGIRREAFFKNGVFLDIFEYGLMKKEYFGKS